MKKIMLICFLGLTVAILLLNQASSMLAKECMNSSYLLNNSDIIINGTIKSVEINEASEQVCTTTLKVDVDTYEKGSGEDEILIKLAGCNDTWVEDTPSFTKDDIGVKGQFFLIKSTYENSSENEFMIMCGSWNKIETSAPGCKNLYWIDNDNKDCGQKEFCGAYMYYGLQTFENKEKCLNAINNSTNCAKEGQSIITPNYKSCCGGLKSISYMHISKSGTCELLNTTLKICSKCGDNICNESIENKCNCPQDCKNQETGCATDADCPQEDCDINSDCEGSVISCIGGKCIKDYSNGRKAEVKIMPQTASQTAIDRLGELNFTIELKEVGTGNNKEVVYELTGKKQGKFLGIFKIMATERVQVDAETGEVKKVIKPWWAFLASGI
jgi:hypothetical protein